MYAQGAGLFVVVAKVGGQRLDVPVEDDADEFGFLVHDRAAGVAANDVVGANEIEGHVEIEGGFFRDPARREVEGRFVVLLGAAGVEAGKGRHGGDGGAVFFVAFHGAVAEAQSEGGVRVGVGAFKGEASFADEGLGLLFNLGLSLDDFAQGAGFGVDETGDFDHGVMGRGDGGGSAGVEFFAEGDVADSGRVNEFGGAGAGGLAGENGDHEGVLGAEVSREVGEGIGKGEDFVIGVDGFVGEKHELEGFAAGFGEFGEAFAVGLGAFVTGAEEAAGEAERIGVEAAGALEEALAVGDEGDALLRGNDALKCCEGFGAIRRIGEFLFEGFFSGDFGAEEGGVLESGKTAVADFAGVLNPKKIFAGAAGVFLTAAAPGTEEDFTTFKGGELVGELVVAEVGELGGGEQAAGAAGVA